MEKFIYFNLFLVCFINLDIFLGWSVENDYIDEKEQACLALKEIAEFTG